ncbi:MAG: LysR substrate-binding domain-containing protein [Gammaproteobacteria bacterium]|nr:LysR substrate-binding domain-containing protein [Gammaproteobacteria bacterium]
MDWITNIKSFIDVVDTNSFSKAADKRYSSAATISRRITWLEDQVGVQLLARTTRSLKLTEEGKFFYEKCKIILDNLNVISQGLRQEQALAGTIKITMPISFEKNSFLLDVFQAFLEIYPQVKLDLNFSNDRCDLLANDFDIAFRAAKDKVAGYHSEELMKLNLGIYASPAYLLKNGIPKTLKNLEHHNCLVNQHLGHVEWEFKNGVRKKIAGNVKSNSTPSLVNLAIKGLGIVRTLEHFAVDALERNQLQPVLDSMWPAPLTIYLVYRSDSAAPKRVQKFVEFIKNKFSQFEE